MTPSNSRFYPRLRSAFLLFSTAIGLPLAVAAQSSSEPLHVTARLVVLDAVVTDASGKPVDNLTANDFRVYEDNQFQTIRSFEQPALHILPPTTEAAGLEQTFDPAQPAAFGQSPITILVLDQLNTHFTDSAYAKRELRDYLAHQPDVLTQPTTLLTLQDHGFKMLAQFTRNRNALEKALDSNPPAYAWKLETFGQADQGPIERLDLSLRALEQMTQSYGRIAGRKNLIWVGGGFPSMDPNTLDISEENQIQAALRHITNLMLAARVTFYAVDPTSSAAGMTEIADEDQELFAQAAGDSLGLNSSNFDTDADFDKLGPITGGRVVRGRNDIGQLIASSIDLGTHYYSLSYTPTSNSNAAADFRKIRIVCVRPGLTVTTRTQYFIEKTAPVEKQQTTSYDLATAAESNIPLNDLHLTATPDPSGEGGYIVHVRASDLTWAAGEHSTASVVVMAVALDANGKMQDHILHDMTATSGRNVNLRDPARNADFAIASPSLRHAQKLRFIVRDAATGKMGSVDVAIHK